MVAWRRAVGYARVVTFATLFSHVHRYVTQISIMKMVNNDNVVKLYEVLATRSKVWHDMLRVLKCGALRRWHCSRRVTRARRRLLLASLAHFAPAHVDSLTIASSLPAPFCVL